MKLAILAFLMSFNVIAEQTSSEICWNILSQKNMDLIPPENQEELDPCFEVTGYQITEYETLNNKVNLPLDIYEKQLSDVIISIDALLAIGKKIWKVVEAGKPVVTMENAKPISVIPDIDGTSAPLLIMNNWSEPQVKSYRATFTNGFNLTVVDFIFTVIFQHSGDYLGNGSYLTSIIILPDFVDVTWGFGFDVKSSLKNITNVGSSVDPIAAAIVGLDYTVESPLKTISSQESFYMSGDGAFKKMSVK